MKEWLYSHNIHFKENTPLNEITKINKKGLCKIFIQPKTIEELKLIISHCIKHVIPFDLVGNLTNTYIMENFSKDILISTVKIQTMTVIDNTAICSCGYNLTKFAKWCMNSGISGYDGFIGIPGTVGAAAINNSGAFNSSIDKVVKYIEILTPENKIKFILNRELGYKERQSFLKIGQISGYVLSVGFDISNKENTHSIFLKMNSNKIYRKKNIDGKRKSLGSVFVSTTLVEIYKRYKMRFFIKKIIYAILKCIIFKKDLLKKINNHLTFFFLGIYKHAKHCDSLNRFCWGNETTESDFIQYIEDMQRLANYKLRIEIDIKK